MELELDSLLELGYLIVRFHLNIKPSVLHGKARATLMTRSEHHVLHKNYIIAWWTHERCVSCHVDGIHLRIKHEYAF